jgi:hypothetical protein
MSDEIKRAAQLMEEASRKIESLPDWKKESLRSQVSALGNPPSPKKASHSGSKIKPE